MINILYAGNEKMFKGLIISLTSVASHTKEPLNLYVGTCDLTNVNPIYKPFTQEEIDFLDKIAKLYNPESKVSMLLMNEAGKDLTKSTNRTSRYTPFCFLRLYIDEVLYDKIDDRLLYIDIDAMSLNDIGTLYHHDLGGKTLGMVVDNVGSKWIRPHYCNAGMLLIDMKKMKETDKIVKAREMVKHRKMWMPDQSAINKIFRHDIHYLPRKYNEQDHTRKNTVVRHYCGVMKLWPFVHVVNEKPWDDIDKFHKSRKEYVMDEVIAISNKFYDQWLENKEPSL